MIKLSGLLLVFQNVFNKFGSYSPQLLPDPILLLYSPNLVSILFLFSFSLTPPPPSFYNCEVQFVLLIYSWMHGLPLFAFQCYDFVPHWQEVWPKSPVSIPIQEMLATPPSCQIPKLKKDIIQSSISQSHPGKKTIVVKELGLQDDGTTHRHLGVRGRQGIPQKPCMFTLHLMFTKASLEETMHSSHKQSWNIGRYEPYP